MDPSRLLIDDPRAAAGDVVHQSVYRVAVAGNRARGKDDYVADLQRHVTVAADGHAREGRERLALRPGDDAEHLLGRKVRDVALGDLQSRGQA